MVRVPNTSSISHALGTTEDEVISIQATDTDEARAFLDDFKRQLEDMDRRKEKLEGKNPKHR